MSKAHYIFTVIIAGVEFHSGALDAAQARELRAALKFIAFKWMESKLGDND